jgi:hypothetical protein
MCYFLYLASPLTLSEVRSMLPAGLSADLLSQPELRALQRLHRDAQTGARVLHGACSCDLVTQRHPVTREDEAGLRRRYREMGYSRERIIQALEIHRRALERRAEPAGHWPKAFAGFVAEHARNAGPTLYYLHFSHDGLLGSPPPADPPARITTATARANPGAWLPEDTAIIIERQEA